MDIKKYPQKNCMPVTKFKEGKMLQATFIMCDFLILSVIHKHSHIISMPALKESFVQSKIILKYCPSF